MLYEVITALLSVFLGGVRKPEMVDLSDNEIEGIVITSYSIHYTKLYEALLMPMKHHRRLRNMPEPF